MTPYQDQFRAFCENLRKKEREPIFKALPKPSILPRFNVLKYDRDLESGETTIIPVAYNLNFRDATIFQKTCRTRSIRIDSELIFVTWYEIKAR